MLVPKGGESTALMSVTVSCLALKGASCGLTHGWVLVRCVEGLGLQGDAGTVSKSNLVCSGGYKRDRAEIINANTSPHSFLI